MSGHARAERSVRPYESLWMLTHRFLWFNLPSASELANGIANKLSTCHGFRLIGDRPFKRTAVRDGLCQLLGLAPSKMSTATIEGQLLLEHTIPEMRFCRECLKLAYHTAIFQLDFVAKCPIHECALVAGCPSCAAEISSTLDERTRHEPCGCWRCHRLLTSQRALIDAPSIHASGKIGRIWRWCLWAANLPRADCFPHRLSPGGRGSGVSSDIELLSLAGRNALPKRLGRRRLRLGQHDLTVATLGRSLPERYAEWPTDGHVQLYKAYRRHLQKTIPGAKQFAQTFIRRMNASLSPPVWTPLPGASEQAYAFLIFRFRLELDGWQDLKNYSSLRARWTDWVSRDAALPNEEDLPKPRWMPSFRCSRREHRWGEGHFFLHLFQSEFRVALTLAREMGQSGRFSFDPSRLKTASHGSYALAIAGSDGSFQFWSLHGEVSLHGTDSTSGHQPR